MITTHRRTRLLLPGLILLAGSLTACTAGCTGTVGGGASNPSDALVGDIALGDDDGGTSGHDATEPGTGEDASPTSEDDGAVRDSESGLDAESERDAAPGQDAESRPDGGPVPDAGTSPYSCAGWVDLGGPLDFARGNYASTPSLSVDGTGRLLATWHETVPGENYNIYVKEWTGREWRLVGEALDAVRASGTQSPEIRVDPFGNPIVVWTEGRDLYASQHVQGAWVRIGDRIDVSEAEDAYPDLPSLAIDPQGRPIVAWTEWDSSLKSEIYVKRWSGSAWEFLGARALNVDPADRASWPSVATGPDGTVFVAFDEVTRENGHRTFVMRWSGAVWSVVSGGAVVTTSGVETYSPSLVVDRAGAPVIALYQIAQSTSESSSHVFRYTQDTWEPVGGAIDVPPNVDTVGPVLTLDANDHPVVAFTESAEQNSVRVAGWTGSAWEALGDALDLAPEQTAFAPAIALDPRGKPSVAWTEWDPTTETMNINVKRCE
ncbi:MAG: hypothetical protein IPK13_09545 [Deltaproteobacteria bacterium]|nr:hypothetical protein [Deltaproteobacteria bacterium]